MEIKPSPWTNERLNQMSFINGVDYLVVHHSDSGDVSAKTIDEWHRSRGFVGIGYHYVIRADGSIEQGRPSNKVGAHAQGFNQRSLGVVLAGDFTEAVPSPAQFDALVSLLRSLKGQYPAAQVVRHRDLMSTSCPGTAFPWKEFLKRLERGNTMDPITINIGDKVITGQLEGDTTTGPVRAIAEAMGGTVTWDEATKTVTVAQNDKKVTIKAGGKTFPAIMVNGKTYGPVRDVAEALGHRVDWYEQDQIVKVD